MTAPDRDDDRKQGEAGVSFFCPRCARRWMHSVMLPERGPWSGALMLRCVTCNLLDYPDEQEPRRFGPVIRTTVRTQP